MLCAHFHALRRNAPLGCVKIELTPTRTNQLARAHERQGHQLHGEPGYVGTRVGVDFSQQLRKFGGGYACVVGFFPRFENVAGLHVGGRVAICETMSDGEAQHAGHVLECTPRHFVRSAIGNRFNRLGDLPGGD